MLTADVPLWLTVVLIVVAVLVTFWAQRQWVKKDPAGYEAWAARAKLYGVKITERANVVKDKFDGNRDGDG